MYIYMYMYMYIYIDIYFYMCMYIYIYTDIYIQKNIAALCVTIRIPMISYLLDVEKISSKGIEINTNKGMPTRTSQREIQTGKAQRAFTVHKERSWKSRCYKSTLSSLHQKEQRLWCVA